MPPITRTAFRIYIACAVLGPVVGFFFERSETPPVPEYVVMTAVLFFWVPFLTIFVLTVHQAYSGRNWARLLLAAITVFGVVAYSEQLATLFSRSPALAVGQTILTLAELLAVALLFTRQSNAWYRERGKEPGQAPT